MPLYSLSDVAGKENPLNEGRSSSMADPEPCRVEEKERTWREDGSSFLNGGFDPDTCHAEEVDPQSLLVAATFVSDAIYGRLEEHRTDTASLK